MKLCKECQYEIEASKKWGYSTLCSDCDQPEEVQKSMGVVIADGKTDYHVQVIRNPTKQQAAHIKSIGRAWDPRTQLTAINKVED